MTRPSKPAHTDGPEPDARSRPSLAESLDALREATRHLDRSSGVGEVHSESTRPTSTPAATPVRSPSEVAPADDPEALAFYRQLEQNGLLVDVSDDAQIAALSPRVTHVRRPDGSIERIGFSNT